MSRFAIIGAGHAGTLAAVGLMNRGHEVTIYSDRTAQSILDDGPPTGIAYLFNQSVEAERRMGVDTFEDRAPAGDGIHLFFLPKMGTQLVQVGAPLEGHTGYAVDVRLKSATRLEQLEKGGAKVVVGPVDPDLLDEIAAANDLTFVSTGRGPMAELFERDPVRSVYDSPQRYLGMLLFTGVALDGTGFPNRLPGLTPVAFNFYGDVGEFFYVPFYHKTAGPCWSLLFEAKADGPLDRFRDIGSRDEMFETCRQLLQEFAPWDWETMKTMEPIADDPHSWLRGQFAPTVRSPIGRTPSGHLVMSLGDTSYAFDPIGGQGANCGSRQAAFYVDAVEELPEGPFNEEWIHSTSEGFWSHHGGPAYEFNNVLLEPLDAAGKLAIISAFSNPKMASAFFQSFDEPGRYFPWLKDRSAGKEFVSEVTGQPWWKVYSKGTARIARGQLRQKVRGRHFIYDDSV
jgi:hypothetical protein